MGIYLNLIAAAFGMISAIFWFRAAQISLTYRFNKRMDYFILQSIFFKYGGSRKPGLRMLVLMTANLNAYAAICAGIAMVLNAAAALLQ
jgi:hypothetical protein